MLLFILCLFIGICFVAEGRRIAEERAARRLERLGRPAEFRGFIGVHYR